MPHNDVMLQMLRGLVSGTPASSSDAVVVKESSSPAKKAVVVSLCYAISCCGVLRYVMPYHVMLCCVTLRYAMLWCGVASNPDHSPCNSNNLPQKSSGAEQLGR
jgi:hypothetical protein